MWRGAVLAIVCGVLSACATVPLPEGEETITNYPAPDVENPGVIVLAEPIETPPPPPIIPAPPPPPKTRRPNRFTKRPMNLHNSQAGQDQIIALRCMPLPRGAKRG
ncbi:hypothetical protein AB8615_11720 [Litorimonas sp. RW-G-Af-16]|uniref:hypothetical protein n=1 Tax=Litorimonas sp. RW-G-Af-16 TaxID=3241168 RepID=UPI003AAC6B98